MRVILFLTLLLATCYAADGSGSANDNNGDESGNSNANAAPPAENAQQPPEGALTACSSSDGCGAGTGLICVGWQVSQGVCLQPTPEVLAMVAEMQAYLAQLAQQQAAVAFCGSVGVDQTTHADTIATVIVKICQVNGGENCEQLKDDVCDGTCECSALSALNPDQAEQVCEDIKFYCSKTCNPILCPYSYA